MEKKPKYLIDESIDIIEKYYNDKKKAKEEDFCCCKCCYCQCCFVMIINILRIVNKNVIVIVAIVANVNVGIVGIKRIVAFIVLRKLNVIAWIVAYVKSLNIVLSYV